MSEYDIVVEKLKKKADAKYKAFNDRIVVSGYETIGVRIPDIKKIAKEIDKKKIGEYLSECKFAYYEDVLIYGFLIAGLPFDEFWQRLYLPTARVTPATWWLRFTRDCMARPT